MRKKYTVIRSLLLSLFASVFFVNLLQAQEIVQSLNSDNVAVLWKVKAQADVNDNAEKICSESFNDNTWVKAIVPGTVFSSYVAAGLEKDPNFGDNIYKVDKQKYDRDFWYRAEVAVPANFTKEKIWLNFNGINRKGEVFFNGQRIGFLDGFMQRGRYDITSLVRKNGKNIVAVLVHWPQPNLANQCSPTYLSSGGWDWMPYVPGLNMGITDKVWLSNTGGLVIKESWIKTSLPSHARADVSVAVEVSNSSGRQLQGNLKGVIQPGNIEFSQRVSVGANNTEEVKIDYKRFSQLTINNPKLWWPNGYGQPNLYTCKLTLEVDGQTSDMKNVQFGIKKYSYDTEGNVLHVSINGTRVFLKGGNWGMSEYMLRCRGDEYDTKMRLHKEMNFNIIRNWLGSTTDDEFYEACDKYGIMVWDDFWINSNPNLPRDINTFNANVIEKIKRVRNHPCVAVWCGDNEGFPEPPLSNWMKENIRVFDGGERHFQPNSNTGNLSGSGVWGNKDPRYYFTAYPKAAAGGDIGWGLRTETGTAVFTNFESFKKFMPQDKWWPRNDMWNIHYFGQYAFNATPDYYEQSLNERYGKAGGIEDFCRKAQLLNIETNKAMYEGWQDHMWDDASGIMTWMSQSAYPSLVWQTYDYYYDLTGAYWGVKKACEPVHIQWNPVTNSVKVVNTTSKDVSDLVAEVAVYNMNGSLAKAYSDSKVIESPANSAMHCFDIKFKPSQRNLALNKPVYASSSEHGDPSNVNDDNMGSRWASNGGDGEWIYVDLGQENVIAGVSLKWEDAYAKAFKIMVSNDAKSWKEVYSTSNGNGGEQQITFAEEKARYVKMQGVERATGWGYSLWDMKVFEGDIKSDDLSDVHFIKLKLTDKSGKLVSDNIYWRGHARKDFTALNNLPKVNLKVTSKVSRQNGKCYVNVKVQNPATSPAVAFATWVQVRNSKTNERILPAIMSDNYFTLLKGEEKEVLIEFNENLLNKGEEPVISVDTYNDHVRNSNIEKKKDSGWGDQGNGTYTNPVLNADYSDPDVIRVGNKYYMVCSEFHYMGMPVLESEDMVNWKIINQVYTKINFPEYDENKRYGGGSWAPAIRYHNGRFWIYFCTPSEGLFMSSATDPAGKWSPLLNVKNIGGWEDPCPLWDDDGQAYIGRSQLGGGPIILHKMSADGTTLLDEGKEIYKGPVAEGTKLFKKDGYYYMSIPEGGVSTGWQTVLRAKNIYGPYEKKVVLEQGNTNVNGPHQGALVETPKGEWWFYHFQSKEPLGRVVHLQPVQWKDGWPIIGVDNDGNGIGEPVKEWKMPDVGKKYKSSYPQTSDEFSTSQLGWQWQVNHNPVNENWSLTDRPGYLTIKAIKADRLREAKNMFTQKVMGNYGEAITELDCRKLAEGQRAGLFCIGGRFYAVGVERRDGKNYIYMEKDGVATQVIAIPSSTVFFKIKLNAVDNQQHFYYSADNITYTECQPSFEQSSGDWKGARVGLFTYNTTSNAGQAAFNWFRYEVDGVKSKKRRM